MIREITKVPERRAHEPNPRYAKDVRDFFRSGAAACEVTYDKGKPHSWPGQLRKAIEAASLQTSVKCSTRTRDGVMHVYLERV